VSIVPSLRLQDCHATGGSTIGNGGQMPAVAMTDPQTLSLPVAAVVNIGLNMPLHLPLHVLLNANHCSASTVPWQSGNVDSDSSSSWPVLRKKLERTQL
jgi:hypothetical protein